VEFTLASVAQIRSSYRARKGAGSTTIRANNRAHHRALEDQLSNLKREHDDLRHAMYEAAQVQRRLCGPRHLRAGSYEFASEIFPVRHLSGDFTTLLEIDGDLVFAIGDIAGKGLMAAMWFSHVIGMVRRELTVLGDPAAALAAINRDLLMTGVEVPLTTLFLARVHLESGNVTYCNAGHPPALLLHENSRVDELLSGGPVLGAISKASFANGKARLFPGSALVAYSDGIPECRNESGIEFGTSGLLTAARMCSNLKPNVMLFSVLAAVENFAGSRRREDDVALVVLRRFASGKMD
jgi:serine phosphatase RsbU (regulator of sigma subunit)